MVEEAAKFFFAPNSSWTSIGEVRLTEKDGDSAGNIDLVLVSYDQKGRLLDFGSLEVQAVYISGNVRRPFEQYMSSRQEADNFMWKGPNFPKADYLSSSRKRLAPQMLYKGGILKAWDKKQAVAIQTSFFETLPTLKETSQRKADIAWMLYDLKLDIPTNRFKLAHNRIVYTEFEPALRQITMAEPGKVEDLINVLQQKLDDKLEGNPPDAPTLTDLTLT